MSLGSGIGAGVPFNKLGGGAAPFTPFFSTFANGKEGWSLDRLVAGYSDPILTIVRPSDSATQDIYLDGNSIDQGAILSFVGAENAQVKTIYGQLGNYNLEQLTLSSQPLIAKAGVILLDGGKPCIEFDGIDDEFRNTAGYSINKSNVSSLMVSRSLETTSKRMQLRLGDGGGRQIYFNFSSNTNSVVGLAGGSGNSPTILYSYTQTLNRQLIDYFVASSVARYGLDGLDVGNVGNQIGTDSLIVVGNWQSGTTYATKMNFQELILFDNADRTSEKSAMRSNINSRYNIY